MGKSQNERQEKKVRNVETTERDCLQQNYAFVLETRPMAQRVNGDERYVEAKVGGITLDLLVDSGSSCNIIDMKTWALCKDQGI